MSPKGWVRSPLISGDFEALANTFAVGADVTKVVQSAYSGCVGPCDVPNVVVITRPSGTEWLGNFAEVEQYRSLLEWAVQFRYAGEMLALPLEFHGCRISPFLHEDFDRSRGAAR
jgi:hypothetical protein